MASSEVDICNSALIKVGADLIVSLDDNNKRATICKNTYARKRDELLRSHPWNFAIDRREFAKLVDTPLYDWDFKYQMPNDVLRILEVLDDDGEPGSTWLVEGRTVVSNLDPFKCKCIVQVTDTSKFDKNFEEALALSIASDISYALTQVASLSSKLFEEYQFALRQARSFDAQEGSIQRVQSSNWANARK